MSKTWQEYNEVKTQSRKRCPQCSQRMMQIEMPDFGPRWQCEDCRITVFLTGGIQPWRNKKLAATG